MAWNLDSDKPIYIQLVERLQMQIVSGIYRPGQRLPSVRELASAAAVNPNTMQRAFTELEGSGLVITRSTNGRTVTDDEELIQKVRRQLAERQTGLFFAGMRELGYTRQEALSFLEADFK